MHIDNVQTHQSFIVRAAGPRWKSLAAREGRWLGPCGAIEDMADPYHVECHRRQPMISAAQTDPRITGTPNT
jgi:hypothetical protein